MGDIMYHFVVIYMETFPGISSTVHKKQRQSRMLTNKILILIYCWLSVAGVSVSIVCDKYVVCLGTRTEAPTLVSGGVDPEPQSAASNTQNVNTPSSSNTNQEL